MTGTIIVSPDRLVAASQEFSTQGSTMAAITSEMLNLVASLSSVWEGDAGTTYMAKFRSLEQDIQTLNRMVQEHVNDLQQMANIYTTAEQQNTEDAAALVSGIIS